jgi:hypothetical protein
MLTRDGRRVYTYRGRPVSELDLETLREAYRDLAERLEESERWASIDRAMAEGFERGRRALAARDERST